MGASIEAFAALRSRPLRRGSVALAVAAARACLRRAGRVPRELDLIVNVGVYPDGLVAEPASAAFVQRRIGANPSPVAGKSGSTFCFDLSNAGCGLVTATQVVDGFLASGRIRLGMVVASDASGLPAPHHVAPGGAALLLGHGGQGEGFVAFHAEDFPEFADLFDARMLWIPGGRGVSRWHRGRNAVRVREKPEYLSRCVESAHQAISRFLARCGRSPSDVELVLSSQHPIGFPAAIARRLGLSGDSVIDLNGDGRVCHSAGPLFALERAVERGRFAAAREVLFVTVGAGITVWLALYRHEPS